MVLTQHPTGCSNDCPRAGLARASSHRQNVGAWAGRLAAKAQSAQWACLAGAAGPRSGRPVKLRLDRDDDMSATGKRHGFQYQWQAAFADDGRLAGLKSGDGSLRVFGGFVWPGQRPRHLPSDNAYYLDALALRSLRCKTTPSPHRVSWFGGPQGMFLIETVLDDIARHLRLDPLAVRKRPILRQRAGRRAQHNPYGMPVEDNIAPALVARELAERANTPSAAGDAAFNAASPVLKRGLALTPVKFGISSTPPTSTRLARWCMSTPTARC